QDTHTTKSQIRISHVEAGYSMTQLRAAYARFADRIQAKPFLNVEEKCRQIAALIADHNIVALDEGQVVVASAGSENRSILANPSDPEMAKKLGVLLNEETGRRPVAALVTVEQADRWFNLPPGVKLYERVLTASV